MTCYQSTNLPSGVTTTGRTSYTTEADCLQACREGACCEGTTCTVKPQCQCQGTGKTFKGVGTVCAGMVCKCCCVNGAQTSKSSDQECVASGGVVRNYVCGKPAPSSMLLTLSLTNYTTTFPSQSPFGSGTWNFNFSCIKTSYTLVRGGGHPVYSSKLYMSVAPEAHISVDVSTSGSFNAGYGNDSCGCLSAILLGLSIRSNIDTVAYRGTLQSQPQLNCAPLSITAGNSFGFSLLLAGQSSVEYPNGVEVVGFCEGQYSVSGTVWGPGTGNNQVQCGTFTLGNPLP